MVHSCWSEQGWDIIFRRPLIDWENHDFCSLLLSLLPTLQINPQSKPGSLIWTGVKVDHFSVKSGYLQLSRISPRCCGNVSRKFSPFKGQMLYLVGCKGCCFNPQKPPKNEASTSAASVFSVIAKSRTQMRRKGWIKQVGTK